MEYTLVLGPGRLEVRVCRVVLLQVLRAGRVVLCEGRVVTRALTKGTWQAFGSRKEFQVNLGMFERHAQRFEWRYEYEIVVEWDHTDL